MAELFHSPSERVYPLPKGGQPARIPLSHDFAEAMAAYGNLVGRPVSLATMSARFDRFQLEVLRTQSPQFVGTDIARR